MHDLLLRPQLHNQLLLIMTTNKVTLEGIKAKITAECYLVLPDGKSTICILSLVNGYTVKGMSACVDAANFDIDTGRKYAYEDAIRQIWPLEGYLLAQRLYENKPLPQSNLSQLPEAQNFIIEDGWVTSKIEQKIIAERKPRKSSAAPYGYKKDGTPKKRPGRPAK